MQLQVTVNKVGFGDNASLDVKFRIVDNMPADEKRQAMLSLSKILTTIQKTRPGCYGSTTDIATGSIDIYLADQSHMQDCLDALAENGHTIQNRYQMMQELEGAQRQLTGEAAASLAR